MRPGDQLFVARRLLAALRSQWWSAERIRAAQEGSLVRIMRHAVQRVPFYRALGIGPESIRSAADLQRFPKIGKRDVQHDPQAFVAADFPVPALFASRTSGSSGRPTTTYFDRPAWLLTKYVLKMRRVAATGGWPLFRRVLVISEQRPEQLGAASKAAPSGLGLLFEQRFLSIHTPVHSHLDALLEYRPHALYAFPSYLLDLIAAAGERGVPLPRIGVLYTSSEVLTDGARERIEAAFRGRLYDVYGSTEFKEVAWQCRAGRYHLNFESSYVEPIPAGATGPVILTSLCNFAMPLLRFDIGDRASYGTQPCDCGRRSPHLGRIAGREGDMITLPSGRRLSPYLLTTAIEADDSLLQYRIVQTAPDALRLELVRRRGTAGRHDAELCAELESILAEPIRLSVAAVERLERAPSGKRSVFQRAPAAAAN